MLPKTSAFKKCYEVIMKPCHVTPASVRLCVREPVESDRSPVANPMSCITDVFQLKEMCSCYLVNVSVFGL